MYFMDFIYLISILFLGGITLALVAGCARLGGE
jgi:hypothetical protein